MGATNTNSFIERYISIYNDKYTYNNAVYTGTLDTIIITCKVHGNFYTIPNRFLRGKGCPECSKELKNKSWYLKHRAKLTNKEFSEAISPELKLISTYRSVKKKVIVEDSLGIQYNIYAKALLKGQLPSIITALDQTDCFIKKSQVVHNNRYSYDKTIYIDSNTPVIINCEEHGAFLQTPSSHLRHRGCPKCIPIYGYKRSNWIDHCIKNNKEGRVYILRCYNKQEEFIKIGITSNKIKNRFNCKTVLPYSYEILKEIGGSPDFVWDKEKELHRLCKEFNYKPLLPFNGHTECFTLNCLELLEL